MSHPPPPSKSPVPHSPLPTARDPKHRVGHYPALSPVAFSGSNVVQRHLESLMVDASRLLRTCHPLTYASVSAEAAKNASQPDGSILLVDVVEMVRLALVEGSTTDGAQKKLDMTDASQGSARATNNNNSNNHDTAGSKNDNIDGDNDDKDGDNTGGKHTPSPAAESTSAVSLTSASSTEGSKNVAGVTAKSGSTRPEVSRMQSRVSLRNVKDAAKRVIQDLIASPLERARRKLREVITTCQGSLNANDLESLKDVLRVVSMPPSLLARPGFMSRDDMDPDTRKFLLTQLSSEDNMTSNRPPAAVMVALQSLSLLKGVKESSESLKIELDPQVENADVDLVRSLLETVNDLDFDVFKFRKATADKPLQSMAYALIVSSGLAKQLNVDVVVLGNFLAEIESRYKESNPYHNATHATDVLQTAHYLTTSSGILDVMTPLELFSLYISAVIHDVEHPGQNNAFQIATGSDFAINFNDQSVLENHSAFISWKLFAQDKYNILANFSKEDRLTFRSTVIALVLATDISSHFAIVGELKSKFEDSTGSKAAIDRGNILLALKAIIKCADISNPVKPFPIYNLWVERVMEEFWRQGDVEKELSLPVSMFMDRETTVVAKCQLGFINFIVKPLFQLTARFATIDEPLQHLEKNLQHYQDLVDKMK